MTLTSKYGYSPVQEEVDAFVAQTRQQVSKWCRPEVYNTALGLIDLTSLTVTDTPEKIATMVHKVNAFKSVYPDYELPASICVYPNFARLIHELKAEENVHITVVGGCFPASQSFLEVKVLECAMAVRDGADEVDIVLAQNAFLAGAYEEASREIREIGEAIRAIKPSVHLKVILETGTLSLEQTAEASFLAIEAGADFIKTSTGKTSPSATPETATVMCNCIKKYFDATGKMIGFKPAGGVASAEDAALYYGIVEQILGDKWLNRSLFRFGASRMANNLLSALVGEQVKYY